MELSKTKVQPSNLTPLLNNNKFDYQMNNEFVKHSLFLGSISGYFSLLPAKWFSIFESIFLASDLQQNVLLNLRKTFWRNKEPNEGFDEPFFSGTCLYFGIVTKRHWSNNITIHCCISSSEAIRWSFIVQFALISENGNCQWCKPLSAWINAVLWRTVGTDKPLFTLKVFNCSFNDFHFSSESFWPVYLVSFSSWDSGVCC